MTSIKQQGAKSLFWSFVETFGIQAIQFIIGIVLARILVPSDYGMVGVLAVFIGVASVLVDSGFKTSIIRAEEITDIDCSTIFYFNMGVSIIVGAGLFFFAAQIGSLFGKPQVAQVARLYAIIPIINGLGLVQSALLIKKLEFKAIAIATTISSLVSGLVAIYLAYNEYSYLSLVYRMILMRTLTSAFLWIYSSWRPKLFFSFDSFKRHFSFGSRLLATGIIDQVFDNIYSLIFGRFYSFGDLGFYTRGKSYADMASKSLSISIQKVSTPLMAASGKSPEARTRAYGKLLYYTLLLIFPLMLFLLVIAEPLILVMLGEKWRGAIIFLQIMLIADLFYPIGNANSSLINVLGRSDMTLKNTMINRSIQTIVLLSTVWFGVIWISWGIVMQRILGIMVSYYLVIRCSDLILKDLLQIFKIPLAVSVVPMITSFLVLLSINNFVTYPLQLIAVFIVWMVSLLFMLIITKVIKTEEFRISNLVKTITKIRSAI